MNNGSWIIQPVDLSSIEDIYMVYPVNICEKTNEMLIKEYKIYLIKTNKTEEEYSFEQFCNYLENWKQKKYSIDYFISSFHVDIEEAKKYVINNIGDINEAGCYEYACISKAPIGVSYYNSEQNVNTDFIVYKYNPEKKEYIELERDNEIFKEIAKYIWGYI